MKLSDIGPVQGAIKARKRVGRGPGSGHGKTSTRGEKGQNCRSGGGVQPWFEGGQMPLQRRVPKRGFTNIFKVDCQVVNLEDLNRFEKGTKINRGTLIEAGLVKKASLPVKVLGRGTLDVALDIEVDAVSRSAAKVIRDAGGEVRLISGKEVPGIEPVHEAPKAAKAEVEEKSGKDTEGQE